MAYIPGLNPVKTFAAEIYATLEFERSYWQIEVSRQFKTNGLNYAEKDL